MKPKKKELPHCEHIYCGICMEKGIQSERKRVCEIIEDFLDSEVMRRIIDEGDWGSCHEIPEFYLEKKKELIKRVGMSYGAINSEKTNGS